jgi:hypothetical protein
MNAPHGAGLRPRKCHAPAKAIRRQITANTASEHVGGHSGPRCGFRRADTDAAAVDQYVKRALHARIAQGLPAAIEDRQTLDRLALLMTATGVAAAERPPGAASATDQRKVIRPEASVGRWQRHRPNVGRPRPGANQTGAGSFTTQHVAGYGEHATPATRMARGGGVA